MNYPPLSTPRPPARPLRPLLLLLAASLASAWLLGGCTTAGPAPLAAQFVPATFNRTTPAAEARTVEPALLQAPTTPFTLGPGDRLDLELIGDPTSRTSVEVGPDGKIYFYLLPGLEVWGLTLPQTRALILEKAKMYLKKDQGVAITLRSVSSQRVWLIGQLNSPGLYPLSGPMTLLEGLAEAGGPTTESVGGGPGNGRISGADLSRSFVLRRGQLVPVDFRRLLQEGDLAQNIYLQPGDFIYLPPLTLRTVHVLGAVATPRAVTFSGRVTLVQTIATAGGTLKDAHLDHVAIIRGSLAQPQIAVVDYQAIIRGTAPDILLEPHDIVYVPYGPYRTLGRYADLILETFARTVGVYEGSRAVSRNNVQVGVNVPIGP